MATVILISQVLMGIALILAFVRVVRGPSLPDRVVALELFASIVVGLVGVYAIRTDVSSFSGRRHRDRADGLSGRHRLCPFPGAWRAAG